MGHDSLKKKLKTSGCDTMLKLTALNFLQLLETNKQANPAIYFSLSDIYLSVSVRESGGFSSSSVGGGGGAPVESVPSGTPLSRYPQPGDPSSPSSHLKPSRSLLKPLMNI